jgi:hypothetical protein
LEFGLCLLRISAACFVQFLKFFDRRQTRVGFGRLAIGGYTAQIFREPENPVQLASTRAQRILLAKPWNLKEFQKKSEFWNSTAYLKNV